MKSRELEEWIGTSMNDDMAVFASVYCLMRFDAIKVAEKVRAGTLSKMEAHGLANLLDGSQPDGIKLVIRGQGKGWTPMLEGAAKYERLVAVTKFVNERLNTGCTKEAAVIDAAMHFKISEPTVYRILSLSRNMDEPTDQLSHIVTGD